MSALSLCCINLSTIHCTPRKHIPFRLSEKGSGNRGTKEKEKEKEKRGKDGKEKEKTKEEESEAKKAAEVFTIQLRNAIGAVVDVKTLPLNPKFVAMSSFHAAVANDRTVYTWQFQSQVHTLTGAAYW